MVGLLIRIDDSATIWFRVMSGKWSITNFVGRLEVSVPFAVPVSVGAGRCLGVYLQVALLARFHVE